MRMQHLGFKLISTLAFIFDLQYFFQLLHTNSIEFGFIYQVRINHRQLERKETVSYSENYGSEISGDAFSTLSMRFQNNLICNDWITKT